MTRVGSTLVLSSALLMGACGIGEQAQERCLFIDETALSPLLGDVVVERLEVGDLEICEWRSDSSGDVVMVQLETVPDPSLFIQHSVEATDPGRVRWLDQAAGSVLFEDEAVLGRHGNQVVLITGTVATDELVPVLEATLAGLADDEA